MNDSRLDRRSVTVLASHHAAGQSMRRYSELLADAYRTAGWEVDVRQPTCALSKHLSSGSLRKLVIYLEKLLLFPLQLAVRPPRTLVHLTDHSDAPWLRRIGSSTPKLATCHDLIAIQAGDGQLDEHRPRWSGRLYQRYISASLARADMIAAVSEATLDDVRHSFPAVSAQLLYNPLAPGVTAFSETPHAAETAPYLLLVAASGWRKRRGLAIETWRRIRAVAGADLRLIIVGDGLEPAEREEAGLPDGTEPGLEIREDVPNDVLAGLYVDAAGLLMMSSHEGFGWPVAEANHWGTVAVCADLPVFHEVGPSNIFVSDDLDRNDWTDVWSQLHDRSRGPRVQEDAKRFSSEVFSTDLGALATSLLAMCPDRTSTAGAAKTTSD